MSSISSNLILINNIMKKQSNKYIKLSQRPNLKKGVESFMNNRITSPRTIERLFSKLLATNCIKECRADVKEIGQRFIDNDVMDRQGNVY